MSPFCHPDSGGERRTAAGVWWAVGRPLCVIICSDYHLLRLSSEQIII